MDCAKERQITRGYADGFGINSKVPVFGGDLFIDDDPKKVAEWAKPKKPRTRFERDDVI